MPVLCLDFELGNREPYYFELAMPAFKSLIDEEIYKCVGVKEIKWHCPCKEEALEFKRMEILGYKGKALVKMEIDIDEWDTLHINSLSLTFKINSI